MAVGDAYVFPGFLTPVLTQLFFPKPPTTFLTCFCRGERRKFARKKNCLNRGSNSQPPGHESDTLTTEPLGRALHWPKTSKLLSWLVRHVSVRPFVCAWIHKLGLLKNFSETIDWIFTRFHRNVPYVVLFQIHSNICVPWRILVAMSIKLKNL